MLAWALQLLADSAQGNGKIAAFWTVLRYRVDSNAFDSDRLGRLLCFKVSPKKSVTAGKAAQRPVADGPTHLEVDTSELLRGQQRPQGRPA